MKGDWDEYIGRDFISQWRRTEAPPRKINTLLSDLLEKEEEIALYKSRLKELEAAFYYNLELISERDLEISVLEKQLRSETEQQEAITRERDELEELVRIIDEKKNRKIQQLETKLALKEDEIRELQRDNMNNVNALKRMIKDIKAQQDKTLYKLSDRYEFQIREFVKTCQEEMEEKEKYYLLEIDTLTGKLEQARREKEAKSHFEKEYRNLKFHLEDVERLFQEKENYYLEEIRKRSKPPLRQITREVQCGFTHQLQGIDRTIQAEPDKMPAECQTRLLESETQYKKKISFLEEQNEVLKCVIKEMKKNRSLPKASENSGCECSAVEMVEQVNKKFEGEINNLRKILEEEKKQRREEEVVIQSLETSVTCLKNKLLMELQENLQQFSGDNNFSSGYNHDIQVTLLEEKLSKKIDALMMAGRQEREMVYEKLEEVKNECIGKMEMYMTPNKEIKTENLLEKIRLEMQKLENKIESDLKNIVRNNSDKNYDKNIPRVKLSDREEIPFFYPSMLTDQSVELNSIWGVYCKNNLASKKSTTIPKSGMDHKIESQTQRIKLGMQTGYGKVRNDLAGR